MRLRNLNDTDNYDSSNDVCSSNDYTGNDKDVVREYDDEGDFPVIAVMMFAVAMIIPVMIKMLLENKIVMMNLNLNQI